MILRHSLVQFGFFIGLAKYRRPVFADYRKITPKRYWNIRRSNMLPNECNSLGFDDPKNFRTIVKKPV